METLAAAPPLFGPPISPLVTAPVDRPLVTALILDLSSSMFGNERVIDMFKTRLIEHFSKMEYDNVLILGNELYEDPGSAVAAIHAYKPPVRNLSLAIREATTNLASIDRFHRRRILLLTDQFSIKDVAAMKAAVFNNSLRLTDIEFFAAAYGPMYSRSISECDWRFTHLDESVELESVLNEVSK